MARDLQKRPIVKAVQNQDFVLNIRHVCRGVVPMKRKTKIIAVAFEGR